jgi:hypothetical protein
LSFSPWALGDLETSRSASADLLRSIDAYIESQKKAVPGEEGNESGHNDQETARGTEAAEATDSIPRTACSLNLSKDDISTIIWATGFTNSLEHIQTPLPFEQLMANLRGITALEGLYVVGAGGLAGSDHVASAKEDASFVTNRIYGVLR